MRMAALPVCLLAACSLGATSLVGMTYPPLPDGYDSGIGSCIPSNADFCRHSIGLLEDSDGRAVAILAKRLVGREDGKAIWRVVDQVDAPSLKDGQNWANEKCYLLGHPDPSVIAIVTIARLGGGGTQWIEARETVWAVRFDVAAGKLQQVDRGSVKCVLPES